MEALADASAAALGGAISAGVLCPLELVKTNLQAKTHASEEDAENQDEPSMKTVAKEMYNKNGVVGFYNGFGYIAVQSAWEKSAYFFAYTVLRRLWQGGSMAQPSTSEDVALGYIAEVSHLPVSIPMDVVLVRFMTSEGGMFAVLQEVLADRGVKGLYKGIQAYLWLGFKPAVQYAVYNQLKYLILAYSSKKQKKLVRELTALQAFVLGAISRAVATLVVYPFIRARVLSASESTGDGKGPPGSVMGRLAAVLQSEGVKGLYTGATPELARGVLSSAIMLAVKERIQIVTRRMLLPQA